MEITKISTKGQVVIPAHFREELKLDIGTTIVISKINDFLILKKVKLKDPKEEFKELTKIGSEWSKKTGVNEENISKLIHKYRGVKD